MAYRVYNDDGSVINVRTICCVCVFFDNMFDPCVLCGGFFVKMSTRFGMSVNNDAVAWKLRVWICFKLKTLTLVDVLPTLRFLRGGGDSVRFPNLP